MFIYAHLLKAVTSARNYINSLRDLLGGNLGDIRLEEVELTEDRKFWWVTLSFASLEPESQQNPLRGVVNFSPKLERMYKLFKVNSETGEVESMKIREL
ncbi:MAG: hypothetical protein SW833_01235 [Cyanobacteriota bacterium]|nr:hypothetical protein [Cyanobacteriota bacterium]